MKKIKFIFINLFFLILLIFIPLKTLFFVSYSEEATQLNKNFYGFKKNNKQINTNKPLKVKTNSFKNWTEVDFETFDKNYHHHSDPKYNFNVLDEIWLSAFVKKNLVYFFNSNFDIKNDFHQLFLSFFEFNNFIYHISGWKNASKSVNFYKILELRNGPKNKIGHFLFWFKIPKNQTLGKSLKVILEIAFKKISKNRKVISFPTKQYYPNEAKLIFKQINFTKNSKIKNNFVFFLRKKIEIKSRLVDKNLLTKIANFKSKKHYLQFFSNYGDHLHPRRLNKEKVFFLRKKAFTKNFITKSPQWFVEIFKLLEDRALPQVLEELKNYFSNYRNSYWHSYLWKSFYNRNKTSILCAVAVENQEIKKNISDFNKKKNFGTSSDVDSVSESKIDADFVFTKTEFTLQLINFLNYPFMLRKENNTPNQKQNNYQACLYASDIKQKLIYPPKKIYREMLYDFLFKKEILDPQKVLPLLQKYLKNNQLIANFKKFQIRSNPISHKENVEIFVNKHFQDQKNLTSLIKTLFSKIPFLYQLVKEKYDIGFFRNHSEIFYCFFLENNQFCKNRNKEYLYLKSFTLKLLNLKKLLKKETWNASVLFSWKLNEVEFLFWMLENFKTKKNNSVFIKFVNVFYWIGMNAKIQEFLQKNSIKFSLDLKKKPIVRDDLDTVYTNNILKKEFFPDEYGDLVVFQEIIDNEGDFFVKNKHFFYENIDKILFLNKTNPSHHLLSLQIRLRQNFNLYRFKLNNTMPLLKSLTLKEFTSETTKEFQENWKHTKNNFYFNFFTDEEFDLPLVKMEPINYLIYQFIINSFEEATEKQKKAKLFLNNLKKFFLDKTKSAEFKNQEKKSFWNFLFSLRQDDKKISLNKFLEDRWEEWFDDSLDFKQKALNVKYVSYLVLWAETTFPMLSFNLKDFPREKKKKLLQNFLQNFLINTNVLKWEDVFPKETRTLIPTKSKKISLLHLNREIFEFFLPEKINEKFDSWETYEKDILGSSKQWKKQIFQILVQLEENKIWKLPIKKDNSSYPVVDLNLYHLFEYSSWDEVFADKNKNKSDNSIARSVLSQIEQEKVNFLENAKYFLKLKFSQLWNKVYKRQLFSFLLSNTFDFYIDLKDSEWFPKDFKVKHFYNIHSWFWKKQYKNNLQKLKNKNTLVSIQQPVLDFLKKISCFFLQHDFDNQLLEFINNKLIFANPSSDYLLMLNKFKNFPETFSFKALFYKLAFLNSEKKLKCKGIKINKIKSSTSQESNNFSRFIFPSSWNYSQFLTDDEMELLFFLITTYNLFKFDLYGYDINFTTFFKNIVSESVISKFTTFFSSSNSWINFLEKNSLLKIPEDYPFFDTYQTEGFTKNINDLFKKIKAFLKQPELKNFSRWKNFSLDILTETQKNLFVNFSEISQELTKLIQHFPEKTLNTDYTSLFELMEKRQEKYFLENIVQRFSQYHPIVNKMYLLGNSQITINNKAAKKITIDLSNIYFLKDQKDLIIDYLNNAQIANIVNLIEVDLVDLKQNFIIFLNKTIAPIWKIIYQYFNIDDFEKKIQEFCVNFLDFQTEKPIFFTKKQLNSQNCLGDVKQNPLVDLMIFAKEKTNQNPEKLSLPVLEEIAKIQHLKPKQINSVFYFFIKQKSEKTSPNQFSDLIILTIFFATLSFSFSFSIFLINIQKIYQAKRRKSKQEKIFFL